MSVQTDQIYITRKYLELAQMLNLYESILQPIADGL